MSAPLVTSERDLETVLAIVRRTRSIVLDVYAGDFDVDHKAPGDPVTEADRRANAFLCAELSRAFPGDAIVAEESVEGDPDALRRTLSSERVFFVDPVDGTREFVARNGEFAIMVGLAVGGAAALGVVLLPVGGEAYAGGVGQAGFVEDDAGRRRPLQVSGTTTTAAARLVLSRSHRSKKIERIAGELGISDRTPCGSVGVKVARVADATADLYVHTGRGISYWDTCAPEALLRSAGGRMTDLDGHPFRYGGQRTALDRGIVASNGALHEPVLAAIRRLGL